MRAPGHSQPWSGGKLTEPVSRQSGTAQASDILPDKPLTWQVTLTFDTSMFEDDVRRTVEQALALSERYRRMKTELEEIDAAAGSAAEKQALAVQSLVKLMIDDPAMVGVGFVTRLLLPLVTRQTDDIVPEIFVRDRVRRCRANILPSQPPPGTTGKIANEANPPCHD